MSKFVCRVLLLLTVSSFIVVTPLAARASGGPSAYWNSVWVCQHQWWQEEAIVTGGIGDAYQVDQTSPYTKNWAYGTIQADGQQTEIDTNATGYQWELKVYPPGGSDGNGAQTLATAYITVASGQGACPPTPTPTPPPTPAPTPTQAPTPLPTQTLTPPPTSQPTVSATPVATAIPTTYKPSSPSSKQPTSITTIHPSSSAAVANSTNSVSAAALPTQSQPSARPTSSTIVTDLHSPPDTKFPIIIWTLILAGLSAMFFVEYRWLLAVQKKEG